MIKIKIEQDITIQYKETINFVTKETPTDITEETQSRYDGISKKEVKLIREFQTEVVDKQTTKTITLLEQQVQDEAKFDLGAVIKAINKL